MNFKDYNEDFASELQKIINDDIILKLPRFIVDHLKCDLDFTESMYKALDQEPSFYVVSSWLANHLKGENENIYYRDLTFIWSCVGYLENNASLQSISEKSFIYKKYNKVWSPI